MLKLSNKQWIAWAAVLFWMASIFYLSSQPASQSFNLSQEMIYVTIQVVKFLQILMVIGLAYVVLKFLHYKKIKITLKRVLILLVVLFFFYSLSSVFLRYFAPDDLHHFVRKNAHFFIYLVLGFLTANAFKVSGISGWKSMLLALALGVLFALSDELHQTFVPGRGGMVSDAVIDSAGVATGILVKMSLAKIKKDYFIKRNQTLNKKGV